MYNRITTVSEYVHYALIWVDDLFAKYFAFLVANLDFEHQKEVVGSSAKSKQCKQDLQTKIIKHVSVSDVLIHLGFR